MQKIKLFTDSSLGPYNKIGFGAYLILNDENESLEELNEHIKIKRFENTSSSKLELQTLLWALDEIADNNISIEIYTDCQDIIGLENRRKKLEKNHFYSTSGKLMNNHDLYKDFYLKLDELSLSFIKVNERNTLIKLSNYILDKISEVLKVEIFGEVGCKNIMNMFQTNTALICGGALSSEGIYTFLNIEKNLEKMKLWESLE
jgi:ribonuclease HI